MVDSEGTSGGLSLFWRRCLDVWVKSMPMYHIDGVILEEDGVQWRFNGIYGESRSEEKEKDMGNNEGIKDKILPAMAM
jgi:hypothetical protein